LFYCVWHNVFLKLCSTTYCSNWCGR